MATNKNEKTLIDISYEEFEEFLLKLLHAKKNDEGNIEITNRWK